MSSDYREGYQVGLKDGKNAGKKEVLDMIKKPNPVPTLRDQFAMAAMNRLICSKHLEDADCEEVAKLAYNMADAMLEERNKRG